jgi:hypothetical protein
VPVRKDCCASAGSGLPVVTRQGEFRLSSHSLTLLRGAAEPASGPFPAGSHGHGDDVVVIPKRGLQFPRQMSFERWVGIGRQLSDIHTSSAWCLGDWLVFGEAAYNGRYRDAIEQTCLDYQTLRNYAWVARRFALSRRRDSLSFGHHAEVAARPEAEQGFWLRKAEELGWSVKRLRRELHASLAERSSADDCQPGSDDPGSPAPPASPPAQLHIPVTPEQLRTYRAAAVQSGQSLEAWAALVLDHIAARKPAADGIRARALVAGGHVPSTGFPGARLRESSEVSRRVS